MAIQPDSVNARQFFLEFCTSAEKHDEAIDFFKQETTPQPGESKLPVGPTQKRLTTFEPEAVETMEQEYRRDLERFATDRDAKIKKIRADSEGA